MSLDYMLTHSALGLFPFSHEIQRRQIVAMMDDMTSVKPEHGNTYMLRKKISKKINEANLVTK